MRASKPYFVSRGLRGLIVIAASTIGINIASGGMGKNELYHPFVKSSEHVFSVTEVGAPL